MRLFKNRREAGQLPGEYIKSHIEPNNHITLALPRSGVPVAHKVARILKTPLDLFMVRKLGVPGHEELAMGAITSGGVRVLNQDIVQALDISPAQIEKAAKFEQKRLAKRKSHYGVEDRIMVKDKSVIVVDDGLATGASMAASIAALKKMHSGKLYVAVPVGPPESVEQIEKEVEEVFCLHTPDPFNSVGYWYHDFTQLTDEQVRNPVQSMHED